MGSLKGPMPTSKARASTQFNLTKSKSPPHTPIHGRQARTTDHKEQAPFVHEAAFAAGQARLEKNKNDKRQRVLERSKKHKVIFMSSDEEEQDGDKDVKPPKSDRWSAKDDKYDEYNSNVQASVQDLQDILRSFDDRITCLEGQSEYSRKQGEALDETRALLDMAKPLPRQRSTANDESTQRLEQEKIALQSKYDALYAKHKKALSDQSRAESEHQKLNEKCLGFEAEINDLRRKVEYAGRFLSGLGQEKWQQHCQKERDRMLTLSKQAAQNSRFQNDANPPSLRNMTEDSDFSSGATLHLTTVVDDAPLSLFSKDTLTRYVECPAGQAVCPRPAPATYGSVMDDAQAEAQMDPKKVQSSHVIQSRLNTTLHNTVTPEKLTGYDTTTTKRQIRNNTTILSLSSVSDPGGSEKRQRANGSQKLNANKRRKPGEPHGHPASPFKVLISDLGSGTWTTSPHNVLMPLLDDLAKEWDSGHYPKWRTTEYLEACLTMKCRKLRTTRKQIDAACVACESAGRACATVGEAGLLHVFPLRDAVRASDRDEAGYWVLST